ERQPPRWRRDRPQLDRGRDGLEARARPVRRHPLPLGRPGRRPLGDRLHCHAARGLPERRLRRAAPGHGGRRPRGRVAGAPLRPAPPGGDHPPPRPPRPPPGPPPPLLNTRGPPSGAGAGPAAARPPPTHPPTPPPPPLP